MNLVFASGNQHKLAEIQSALGQDFQLISMRELGFLEEIDETGSTLEENAAIKARHINGLYHVDCLADDSGLEIESLNSAPGVFSARFAGEGCSYQDNTDKVLRLMLGETNRKAVFKTVFHLIYKGEEWQFNGIIEGYITEKPRGNKGFGYDPIFQPAGSTMTFAEMEPEQKNAMSHRALATAKLSSFLKAR